MSTLSLRKIKHDSSAVDNITLDSSGNVLVGTSAHHNFSGLTTEVTVSTNNTGTNAGGAITFGSGSGFLGYMGFQESAGTLGTYTSTPLLFNTSNTERVRIDASGRMTNPYQPSFYANITSGYSISSGQTNALTFNSVIFNVGNHYNSSTNTFTAPIAGRYMFLTSVGGTGGMPANSYFGIAFRVNGSTQNAQWQNSASGYQVQKHSQIFNLSAGDTVTVWCEVASSFTVQNPFFQGILLG